MNIFGFQIKRVTKQPPIATEVPVTANPYRNMGGSFINTSYIGEGDAAAILRDCRGNMPKALEPRETLELWRAMYDAIPLFGAATARLIDVRGAVRLVSDDPGLQAVLDNFSENVTVRTAANNSYVQFKGINSLINFIEVERKRNGMGFCELFSEAGKGITHGIVLDASFFNFVNQGIGTETYLEVQTISGPRKIEPSAFFVAAPNSTHLRAEFTWQAPLAYASLKTSSNWIRGMKAWIQYLHRVAVPPMLHKLSGGVEKDGTMFVPQSTVIAVEAAKNDYFTNWPKGMKQAVKDGEPFDYGIFLPGDFSLETSNMSAGVEGPKNWKEEMEFLAVLIAMTTDVPTSLMGMPQPGGLGTDQFKQLMNVLNRRGAELQETTSGMLKEIVNTHLISIGAPPAAFKPGAYTFEWSPITEADMLERAEADKAAADAVIAQADAGAAIFTQTGSLAGAHAYFDEIGRPEWKTDRAAADDEGDV